MIDSTALVEAASEAGIPTAAVQQSLAIERLGPTNDDSTLDRLVGPPLVMVERTIDVAPDLVLDRLATWLKSRHYLRQERSMPGEVTWAKRKGLAASALRSSRTFTGEGRLGDVQLLRAQAIDVDGARSVVRLTVDRSRNRRVKLATGSLCGVGTVVAVGGAVLATPIALASVPLAVVGVGVTRSGNRHATDLERELLRLLDAVEQGHRPRSIVGRAVSRSVRSDSRRSESRATD